MLLLVVVVAVEVTVPRRYLDPSTPDTDDRLHTRRIGGVAADDAGGGGGVGGGQAMVKGRHRANHHPRRR